MAFCVGPLLAQTDPISGFSYSQNSQQLDISLSYGVPEGNPDIAPKYFSGCLIHYYSSANPGNAVDFDTYAIYMWIDAAGGLFTLRTPASGTGGEVPVQCDPTKGDYPDQVDLTPPNCQVMTRCNKVRMFEVNSHLAYDINTTAPYYIGVSQVAIHDPSGAAVPGAVLHMFQTASGVGYVGTLNYAVPSGKTTLLMGQGLYNQTDCPFAAGLSSQQYAVCVTAPGYNQTDYVVLPGTSFNNQVMNFTVTQAGTPGVEPTNSISPTTLDPQPTATPPATGTGTGLGFPGDFFTQLKNLMIQLFTPAQSDVDALRAATGQFLHWGPFGLSVEIVQIWNFETTTGAFADTSADPAYWFFPLSISAITSTPAASNQGRTPIIPQGYDPKAPIQNGYAGSEVQRYNTAVAWNHARTGQNYPYMVARSRDGALHPSAVSRAATATDPGTAIDPNLWANLIPRFWDMTPYAPGIVDLRWILWTAGWAFFVVHLRNKFTPSLRI